MWGGRASAAIAALVLVCAMWLIAAAPASSSRIVAASNVPANAPAVVAPASAPAVHAANAAYVQGLFQDLLGRPGSQTQIASYVAALDGGATHLQIANEFVSTPDFRANQIRRYYLSFEGRPADATSLQAATGGPPLGKIAMAILASPEYYKTKGGTNAGFVGGLYSDLVGRAIPRQDWEVLVAFLEGDPDRPIVVGRVWNSSEAQNYRVDQYAETYLGRALDPSSLQALTGMLHAGQSEENVIAAMVSSSEYIAHHPAAVLNAGAAINPPPSDVLLASGAIVHALGSITLSGAPLAPSAAAQPGRPVSKVTDCASYFVALRLGDGSIHTVQAQTAGPRQCAFGFGGPWLKGSAELLVGFGGAQRGWLLAKRHFEDVHIREQWSVTLQLPIVEAIIARPASNDWTAQ